MSQDDVTCAKCDKPCGYDDSKAIWFGSDRRGDYHAAICGQCKMNLISRFSAFFGLEGSSSDEYGLDIEWHQVAKILSAIKQDYAMRLSYLVPDRELYERTKTISTPIEEE
ncbi:hypothetical protein LCGC14_0629420 [marine sediment metagenome]|uniref:Uncharacterized protein n=1 Tax=marine sediment metagenome TaxID=412755 RepID=A0A0F9RLY7_9ZZZZ